jgi:ubiquinone biosynthesis protein
MNQRIKRIIDVIKKNDIFSSMNPTKLCTILEELGPTYIKIGQILSTRVDLLPDEYIKELSKLRSSALPLDSNTVKNILNDSYVSIDEIFNNVESTPVGSASIAQVHIGYLKDNTKVVIKIKRPNIDDIMIEDINLLKEAVKYLHLNKIIKAVDLELVLDELENTTKLELDFNNEVNNLLRFRKDNKDINYIYIPKVYPELCTKNTIVMEYIEGVPINKTSYLKDNGFDLETIALLLSENYLYQALDCGFFHADPHPDNILITNNNITYLDFGMMGSLNARNKELLKDCTKAIINENYSEVSRILLLLSTQIKEVDNAKLQSDIRNILTRYGSSSLEDISIKLFIKDMFNMLQSNSLILDKDITMLIRGIGIIEGVLNDLDPNINLVGVLANKLEKDTVTSIVSSKNIKKIGKSIITGANGLVKLPSDLSNLITSINNGEIKFKVEFSDSSTHIDKIEKLLHEFIVGFLDGILIIGLCITDDIILKSILTFFIVVLSVWLIYAFCKDRFHNGY